LIHAVNHQKKIKPKTVAVFALDQNRDVKGQSCVGAPRQPAAPTCRARLCY